MKTTRLASKDDILLAYVNSVVDSMDLDELKESLMEFIYDDMHPLSKREILEYVDIICPDIIEEE